MLYRTYWKNALILTLTGLVLRTAGMFFRIYVASQIGAEGMGLYQLIYSVYAMAVTAATSGLSVASTRLCAALMAENNTGGAWYAVKKVMQPGILFGACSAAVLYSASGIISQFWLKDPRAAASLRILSLSLPFTALSACMRGYFMARRNVRPDSRAQLLEQCVRIGFVASVIGKAARLGTGKACAAVFAGNTISEAVSWLYMACCMYADHRRLGNPKACAVSGIGSQIRKITMPIAAGHYLTGLLRTVENVMVPGCVARFTGSRAAALSRYGALRGMAMPVVFFPFSLLSALSSLLLPEITQARSKKQDHVLKALSGRAIRITMVFSVPAGGIFALFSRELGMILYKSEEIGFYLRVLGPLMPLMYLESIVDGILKGLGEQLASFRYAAADSAVRIVLIALLAPQYGMAGFLFVMIFSNLLTCMLNLNRLLHVTGMRFEWMQWAAKPVLCFLCAVFAYFAALIPAVKVLPDAPFFRVCCGAVFVLSVYFALAFLTGCAKFEKNLFFFKKVLTQNKLCDNIIPVAQSTERKQKS